MGEGKTIAILFFFLFLFYLFLSPLFCLYKKLTPKFLQVLLFPKE